MTTICMIAGEPSGDMLGAHLAHALKKQHPEYQLYGVGSRHMADADVKLIFDSTQLAIIGLFEVLQKLPLLRRCMHTVMQFLKNQRPDLLILIDYPGFNLRLAEKATRLGIKVMYYASPQIWAWHYSRIKKIKKNVDLMAVLFPFEEKFYAKEQVPVKFVGHPLAHYVKPSLDKLTAYQQFKLDPQHITIGLLPGSRQQEILRLLPTMLATAQLLRVTYPTAQFILPLAPALNPEILSAFDLSHITLVQHNTYNALQLCQAAIVASGTATLEVALLQVPMVIIYKINPLTAFIAKFMPAMKKIQRGEKSIGLCNIVLEESLMPELLQDAATPTAIYQHITQLLKNHQQLQQKLMRLPTYLQGANAADKAATAAIGVLEKPGY